MNRFRIAYIINQYPKTSHTFIRREILALERQGFTILRVAMQGWDAELADEVDLQERAHTRYVLHKGIFAAFGATLWILITAPRKFLSALVLAIKMARGSERSLPYHLIYLAEACRILLWLKAFGATHVHAHFGTNSAEVAMLTRAVGGPPYSFTVHGQEELLFGGIAEKARRAAFIVAISNFGRSQLYRRIKLAHWPKVNVVHCGLEPAFYSIPWTPPTHPMRFVCVGRLCIQKGQALLLEAIYRIAKNGVRVELVLAGDGEMRGEMESLIELYELAGQVRITGWISSDQVRDEILAARALVLPSFSEGLPVVLMEAMALRRPVLTTYIAGIPELVLPGENGWLFPAGSIDDLTAALENCLATSPDELRKMGELGFLRVTERHSIDVEASKLANFFHSSSETNSQG